VGCCGVSYRHLVDTSGAGNTVLEAVQHKALNSFEYDDDDDTDASLIVMLLLAFVFVLYVLVMFFGLSKALGG